MLQNNKIELGQWGRVIFGGIILYYVYSLVGLDLNITNAYEKQNGLNLILAVLLFTTSFLLKFQRLVLILREIDSDVVITSIRAVFRAHVNSSILSLVLPFKLGDFARVMMLKRCIQGYPAAIGTVLLERLLDLATVFVLVIMAGSIFSYLEVLDGMMAATRLVGLLGILIFFYCGFKTIVFWHSIFLKRNFLRFGPFMALAEHMILYVRTFAEILKKQGFLLIALTIAIWVLEASSFLLIYFYLDADASLIFFLGLLSLIAFGLPAGPVGFGPVQLVFYFAFSIGLIPSDISQEGLDYSLFVYLPALVILALVSLFVGRGRSSLS